MAKGVFISSQGHWGDLQKILDSCANIPNTVKYISSFLLSSLVTTIRHFSSSSRTPTFNSVFLSPLLLHWMCSFKPPSLLPSISLNILLMAVVWWWIFLIIPWFFIPMWCSSWATKIPVWTVLSRLILQISHGITLGLLCFVLSRLLVWISANKWGKKL